jgi:hypothetical protein
MARERFYIDCPRSNVCADHVLAVSNPRRDLLIAFDHYSHSPFHFSYRFANPAATARATSRRAKIGKTISARSYTLARLVDALCGRQGHDTRGNRLDFFCVVGFV